jgi:stearoyl-CoA desaturase (delta-9 desaturase)
VPYCGLFTMGEAYHNNHHAFPASARLGLYDGETDPGWWVLRLLETVGLVSNLKTPESLPTRPSLVRLAPQRGAASADTENRIETA